MPACARKEIFEPDEVGVYHCINRCVRQAFLCGYDKQSGKDYGHRKEWFDVRIKQLQQVFMVDMLGYSFLDNHFHNTIRNRPDLVAKLSDYEVARRSLMISPNKMPEGVELAEPSRKTIKQVTKDRAHIRKWRKRLSCISCYMRYLKEVISRRANAEDEVTGAFWEGRFKSIRLLDELAVTICSLYVDLNEVRANMATTPEKSKFTSIAARATWWRKDRKRRGRPSGKTSRRKARSDEREPAPDWLTPINEQNDNGTKSRTMTEEKPSLNSRRPSNSGFLPMTIEQYLNLCDWVGRTTREGKRGKIPSDLAPILERLTRDVDVFLHAVEHFTDLFKRFCGSPQRIREVKRNRTLRRLHGLPAARRLYSMNV